MTATDDPIGDALEQRAEDSTVIMSLEYRAEGDEVDDEALAHWLRAEIALAEHEESISSGPWLPAGARSPTPSARRSLSWRIEMTTPTPDEGFQTRAVTSSGIGLRPLQLGG